MTGKKDLKYEIIEQYGVISEKSKGWKREINKISWNDAEPKFDIRDWSPDHEKMGKGITLTEEELLNLIDLVKEKVFSPKDAIDERLYDDLFRE